MAGTRPVAQRLSPKAALENLRILEQLQRWLHTNVQEALALEVGLLKLQLVRPRARMGSIRHARRIEAPTRRLAAPRDQAVGGCLLFLPRCSARSGLTLLKFGNPPIMEKMGHRPNPVL